MREMAGCTPKIRKGGVFAEVYHGRVVQMEMGPGPVSHRATSDRLWSMDVIRMLHGKARNLRVRRSPGLCGTASDLGTAPPSGNPKRLPARTGRYPPRPSGWP